MSYIKRFISLLIALSLSFGSITVYADTIDSKINLEVQSTDITTSGSSNINLQSTETKSNNSSISLDVNNSPTVDSNLNLEVQDTDSIDGTSGSSNINLQSIETQTNGSSISLNVNNSPTVSNNVNLEVKNTPSVSSDVTLTVVKVPHPKILEYSYDASHNLVNLVIDPDGASETDVYINDIKVSTIQFEQVDGVYQVKDCTVPYTDTISPDAVNNINIARTPENDGNAILNWQDGLDNENDITISLEPLEDDTAYVVLSTKTDVTYHILINGIETTIVSDTNLNIPIRDLPWGSNIAIKSVDENGNESPLRTLRVPDPVIYNPNIVDDYVTMNENETISIDAKANDIHDTLYDTPIIVGAEITNGAPGKVSLIDYDLDNSTGDYSGIIVNYISEDGYFGDVVIKYTYSQVRDDVPPAYGYIYITINQRNQEPVAVDDGLDVTQDLEIEDGIENEIPSTLLLANDTDRETPNNLSITQVRNCTAGSVSLSEDKQKIILTPTAGFGGTLTFEYRITDGELESKNWATVTLSVKMVDKAPTVYDVNYTMQITDTSVNIIPKIENNSSQDYIIENNLEVYLDGGILSSDIAVATVEYMLDASTNTNKPYVKLTLKDASYLSVGDILKIPYTAKTAITGDSASANIYVTLIEGDEPDNNEGVLYVHRRPLALFTPVVTKDTSNTYITGASIPVNNEFSYDLDWEIQHSLTSSDRPSYSKQGVRCWEWGVRLLDGDWVTKQFDASNYGNSATSARSAGITWVNSQLSSTIRNNPRESLMVSLRVRDIDGENALGEWSEPRTILLSSVKMPPVALFKLDKSTYTVPKSTENFEIKISDMSYDANGDDIKTWYWTLTGPDGKVLGLNNAPYTESTLSSINTTVSRLVKDYVNKGTYSPTDPTFKLTLVVEEDTPDKLKSDAYSVSFKVYKENYPPEITDKPGSQTSTLEKSMLYEIDDGADGFIGDNWGTQSNTVHRGTIDFQGLFTITDDQPLTNLTLNWLFDGQKIIKRSQFDDDGESTVQKSYSDKKYQPFEAPFTNTVTDQGFSPGAYKLTVTVKDNPTGNGYMSNSSQMAIWHTNSDKQQYHFYVVPKLDLYMHNEVNGWIDQAYRESDGATLTEAGLELDDIAPTIGDTINLFGKTNQYVINLWGYIDENNNNKCDEDEDKFMFNRTAINADSTFSWESSYTIEDIADAPSGSDFTDLNIKIVGETNWGSETGDITRTKQNPMIVKVLPVKLYDFRVTSVTDPDVSDTFDNYVNTLKLQGLKLTNGTVIDGVPVGKLAVDNNTLNGSVLRKGYSFYFSINSKGLAKENDEVRITPKFYSLTVNSSGVTAIGNELIGYLPNKSGVYEAYTGSSVSTEIEEMYELYYEGNRIHSLNTHADVRIPITLRSINSSEQTWYGRYGIPADAKFFPVGSTVSSSNEYTGEILVTFEIVAYKDGKPRYNYVERSQWEKERQLVPDSLKLIYKAKEADWKASNNYIGTVIVYSGTSSIKDDYISNPVWNE